jgi:CheY-like chemotaxis protein
MQAYCPIKQFYFCHRTAANVLKPERERCTVFGATDYITKPYTLAKLHAVLGKNLPGRVPALGKQQSVYQPGL